MANIKITVEGPLMDGHKITFKAPCNCDVVEKLDVRYIENNTNTSKLFTMKDAHGNTLTGLGNLFAKNAYVHAVLDTVNKIANLQNSATNGYLEHRNKNRTENLQAANWSGSAPYTQTVNVSGITANDTPMILMGTPSTQNATTYKSTKKAYGMIDRAVTGSGTITFYCYSKKPTVAIPIIVKGA